MGGPVFAIAVRLRLLQTALMALGMTLVILMVGALFPAVGDLAVLGAAAIVLTAVAVVQIARRDLRR